MKNKLLYTTLLVAPTAAQMAQATEHLRYWPYVKAYRHVDASSVMLTVNMGRAQTPSARKRINKRTRELIGLCLRQYQVKVAPVWWPTGKGCLGYTDETFLRPDSKLKPFSDFIKNV